MRFYEGCGIVQHRKCSKSNLQGAKTPVVGLAPGGKVLFGIMKFLSLSSF